MFNSEIPGDITHDFAGLVKFSKSLVAFQAGTLQILEARKFI